METKIFKLIVISLVLLLCIDCSKKKTSNETVTTRESNNSSQQTLSPEDKKIILEIGDKKFTNADFKNYLKIQYPDMDSVSPQGTDNSRLMSRLFDSYIEHATISYAADQETIAIGDEEINKYLENLNLLKQNMDRAVVSQAIKVQKFLYYRIYNTINVTDREIQDYYNNNNAQFQKKAEIHLFQIVLKDKETAQRIRGILVNNPEKFAEFARTESISLYEKEKGGDMGFFEKGSLPKDMEDVVFSLNPNSISPVVPSSYGYHIFKVESKKKERLLYLEKVKPEIRNILMAEKTREAYQNFLNQTKQNTSIAIKYEELNFKYQQKKSIDQGEQGDENKKTVNSSLDSNSGNPGNA